jgi:uncharacterized membrane protein YdjX (TVP38/TMEM64 family)
MDRRNLGAIVFVVIIAAVITAYLFTPLGDWLSLQWLKSSRDSLAAMVAARPFLSMAAFFLFCVVATSLCFPAAPILGLAGGALFGFWIGLAITLAASAIGSTIAFFGARYLLRGLVEQQFGRRAAAIDRGIKNYGGLYLLVLRFNPLIPYWLVNLAIGLTAMRSRTYMLLTPLGLLPATFIYVSAGTRLASIRSPGDVTSLPLIGALLLLSLLPLALVAARPAKRSRA